jgi:hypothetical protein
LKLFDGFCAARNVPLVSQVFFVIGFCTICSVLLKDRQALMMRTYVSELRVVSEASAAFSHVSVIVGEDVTIGHSVDLAE